MAKPSIIPKPETSDRVRQIAVPPEARALSRLTRIDYEDAFLVDIGGAPQRTAEQWARAAVDAPASVQRMLQSGWSAIGLQLGGASPDRSILGWEIRNSTPEFVLLGGDSRAAMAGELLFKRQRHTLLFCTFVKEDDQRAREVWARTQPTHVRTVRYLLEQAATRGSMPATALPGPEFGVAGDEARALEGPSPTP